MCKIMQHYEKIAREEGWSAGKQAGIQEERAKNEAEIARLKAELAKYHGE